jgi:MFS family permease
VKSIAVRTADWSRAHWGVFVVGIVSLWLVRHRAMTFDGSMNLQVQQSLAAGRGYARHYHETLYFSRHIETNGPVIFLGAALIWVFGQHNLIFQAANVIFVLLVALSVTMIIKGRFANAMLVLLFLGLPELAQYAFGGYGEFPMLAFELAAIVCVAKAFERDDDRLLYLAALFGGFAFVTKIVGVAVLVPLGAAILVRYWRRWPGWRVAVQLVGAFVLAPFLWEIYRFFELGSFGAWKGWWSDQLDATRFQATGGATKQLPLDDSLWRRLGTLAAFFRVSEVTMAVLFVLGIGALVLSTWFLFRSRELHAERFYIQLGITSMVVAYFVWWFFITPDEKAWYRRVIVAIFLFLLGLFHLLVVAAADRAESRATVARRLSAPVLVVVLLLVVGPLTRITHEILHPNTTELDTVVAAAAWVNSKPAGDRFFGYDFWSAPVISSYANRDFLDLKQVDGCSLRVGHDYLVLDRYATTLGFPGGFNFASRKVAPITEVKFGDNTSIWEIGPAATCG